MRSFLEIGPWETAVASLKGAAGLDCAWAAGPAANRPAARAPVRTVTDATRRMYSSMLGMGGARHRRLPVPLRLSLAQCDACDRQLVPGTAMFFCVLYNRSSDQTHNRPVFRGFCAISPICPDLESMLVRCAEEGFVG